MGMDYSYYRADEFERCTDRLGVTPLDILIAGATGAGKSTTLNALLDGNKAAVGQGADPQTMEVTHYRFNNDVRFWDTPGLGDSPENDKRHIEKLDEILSSRYGESYRYGYIDMALMIIDGSVRDMNTAVSVIELLKKHLDDDRIIIAVNQADFAMKGLHFDYAKNQPDSTLTEFLNNKVRSVQRRLSESVGGKINLPVYYSAEYGYNITGLLDTIIKHLPDDRRLAGKSRKGIKL